MDTLMFSEDVARYYIELAIKMREAFNKKYGFFSKEYDLYGLFMHGYRYPDNYYYAYYRYAPQYNREIADLFKIIQLLLDDTERYIQIINDHSLSDKKLECMIFEEIDSERNLLLKACEALSADKLIKEMKIQNPNI